MKINRQKKLLIDIIDQQHESFAIVWRSKNNAGNYIELFTGVEHQLTTINEIDTLIESADKNKRCFVLVPYKQISERGYAVIEDSAPLILIDIKESAKLLLTESLTLFPDCDSKIQESGFSDSDAEYKDKVVRIILDEIGSGNGANFVVKRTFCGKFDDFSLNVALSLFRRLISKETGAYWTFVVKTRSHILVGASPEQHIALKEQYVSMMPISGTYRYPISGATQEGLVNFLCNKKEEDELYMVLDEELKVMTRICNTDVRVDGPFLTPMSKLLHTGYRIYGKTCFSISNILKYSMFAPTVMGSPVENAAKVIARYEPQGRSYYSGFVALIEYIENVPSIDSCILIRTLEINRNGDFLLSVGATLVRESDPCSELEETKSKIAALKEVMGLIKDNHFFEGKHIEQILLDKNNRLGRFWFNNNEGKYSLPSINNDIVIIDNEDSFTSMIKYQLKMMGIKVKVIKYTHVYNIKNNEIIIIGPGPGDPRDIHDPRVEAGVKIIQSALKNNQMLIAVCFGHQLLCQLLGLNIELLSTPNQGIQKEICFFGKTETVGFYNTFTGVYNPIANNKALENVNVSFDKETGHIFGLRGQCFSSMQFHPESILTIDGPRILHESIFSAMQQ